MYRVHKKLDKICEGAISRASVASLTARRQYSASASMEHGTHREQPRPTANELAPADRMLISGPLLLLKFPPGKRNLAHTHSPHTTLSTHHTLPPSPEILVGNASPAKTNDSYTWPRESPPPSRDVTPVPPPRLRKIRKRKVVPASSRVLCSRG